MRRTVFSIIISGFAILLLATASLAQKKKELKQEWLAKDIEATQLISQIMSIESQSIEYFKNILGNNGGTEEEDFGFGARRVHIGRHNGYTSFYVNAFTFNGTIFYYEVGIRGNSYSWRNVRQQIIEAWEKSGGPEFKEGAYGLVFTKTIDSVFQLYKARVGTELGELRQLEVPSELKEHYEHLISPIYNSQIGEVCGYGGSIPPGRVAIDALVKNGRVDLMENVLRGYNPGGRVYAVLELLKMKKAGMELSPQAQSTLNIVLNLPVHISICDGCFLTRGLTAKDVVRIHSEK